MSADEFGTGLGKVALGLVLAIMWVSRGIGKVCVAICCFLFHPLHLVLSIASTLCLLLALVPQSGPGANPPPWPDGKYLGVILFGIAFVNQAVLALRKRSGTVAIGPIETSKDALQGKWSINIEP